MTYKKEILDRARTIALGRGAENLEHAESILLEYLKTNPQDTDAWLMLIMIEWTPPLEDFDKISSWSKSVLAYDPTNVQVLLVLAEAYNRFRGDIPDEVYAQLCKVKSKDYHLMAMVEMARANYFEYKSDKVEEYENALRRSIEYGPHQNRNHRDLGNFLIKQGNIDEGEKLIKKAQENRKQFSAVEDDDTNVMDFLNCFYAGL